MASKKERSSKNGNKKKPRIGLGFALWLLAAIVILIIFLVNQKKIASNLKSTGFFDRVVGKTPAFVEKAEVPENTDEKNDVEPFSSSTVIDLTSSNKEGSSAGVISQNNAATQNYENSLKEENNPQTQDQNQTVQQIENQDETQAAQQVANQTTEQTNSTTTSTSNATMKLKLYFMMINSDGSLSRKEVVREMKKSDSPLTDAINAVIDGPQPDEGNCRTLVSSGCRLLGASVSNSVATLNFSEEFEFNQYGIEGVLGQLQQIVYTATAFPTVESVQFLIEGEHREFLASEGVSIGVPLSRSNF
ncbi:MAG: GerMN domain-containing protein [Treponema sp.]|nr:GerMN domain-containing protein [Treponema sp.]